MLTHLVGTPYMPQVDGGILFVEDVSEHPYRVERMLLQLLYSGVLARQKAVLLGDFSNYRLGDFDNGYDFDAMLTYFRTQSPVPVLTGLPFGHVRDKATLAVGCQATLRSDTQNWQLTMSGYPVLEC
jgi:muramoyltetrapeptide carboxypeptidase